MARDENFGPVLSVITVDSFDQAIAVANDTACGLCASIFTANGKRALCGAHQLRARTVTLNTYGEGDIATPFEGYKQSGFGGRDNSVHAQDQYTQLKTIWVDLPSDLASDDYAGAGGDAPLIALNRQTIAFAQDAVAEYQIDPAFADPAGNYGQCILSLWPSHAGHVDVAARRLCAAARGRFAQAGRKGLRKR